MAPSTNPNAYTEDVKPIVKQEQLHKALSGADFRAQAGAERQKRAYTRPENASCACKECGKLFQRSYNLKAHMDTHDPHRSHPNACNWPNCGRRFVRRTDLMRHEQSVSPSRREPNQHLELTAGRYM